MANSVSNQATAIINGLGVTPISVPSNTTDTDIIDLQFTKAANTNYVLVGGTLCYTVTAFNNSDVDFVDPDATYPDGKGGIVFSDTLASNVSYKVGSFTYQIDSGPPVSVEPDIDTPSNTISYNNLQIPADSTAVVKFCVIVNSAF